MKIDDDEWGEWAADFRHAAGPSPEASAVVEAARRGHLKQGAKLAVEVVAHVFVVVVFSLLCVREPRVWPFASLVLPAFFVSLGYTLHARSGTWSAAAETVRGFVDLEWRRKRAEVRLLRFGRRLLAVLAVGFAIWLPYFLAAGGGRADLGLPFLVARLCFAVVTFTGAFLYIGHKERAAKRAFDRIDSIKQSLDGTSSVAV
jgi:hypothetical protein